ncbi:MAG: adenylyl-sulfate kinase [Ekhidna sp.]
MEDYKKNIISHSHTINRTDRMAKNGHSSLVFWFTGLSGSGKSTLASEFESYLHNQGCKTYILDGDNIRNGINNDLDFSEESRTENIRRISEISKLFVDAGTIVLTAFISPFLKDREQAKQIIGKENFIEIHVDCPLDVCEKRDVKGLYKKARNGEIKYFTGIDSPFEFPEFPDISIDTANNSLEVCLQKLIEEIEPKIKY